MLRFYKTRIPKVYRIRIVGYIKHYYIFYTNDVSQPITFSILMKKNAHMIESV